MTNISKANHYPMVQLNKDEILVPRNASGEYALIKFNQNGKVVESSSQKIFQLQFREAKNNSVKIVSIKSKNSAHKNSLSNEIKSLNKKLLKSFSDGGKTEFLAQLKNPLSDTAAASSTPLISESENSQPIVDHQDDEGGNSGASFSANSESQSIVSASVSTASQDSQKARKRVYLDDYVASFSQGYFKEHQRKDLFNELYQYRQSKANGKELKPEDTELLSARQDRIEARFDPKLKLSDISLEYNLNITEKRKKELDLLFIQFNELVETASQAAIISLNQNEGKSIKDLYFIKNPSDVEKIKEKAKFFSSIEEKVNNFKSNEKDYWELKNNSCCEYVVRDAHEILYGEEMVPRGEINIKSDNNGNRLTQVDSGIVFASSQKNIKNTEVTESTFKNHLKQLKTPTGLNYKIFLLREGKFEDNAPGHYSLICERKDGEFWRLNSYSSVRPIEQLTQGDKLTAFGKDLLNKNFILMPYSFSDHDKLVHVLQKFRATGTSY